MGDFNRTRHEHLGRGSVSQGLVGTLGVVETEVLADPNPGIPSIPVRLQIHLLVLHTAPQPLYKQVVGISPCPVHADPDSMLLQEPAPVPFLFDYSGPESVSFLLTFYTRTLMYETISSLA